MEEEKSLMESLFSEDENRDEIFKLCDIVRETSYSIHKYLRHGHLESVYERALAHRLTKLGLSVQQQVALPVYDEDGTELGVFYADLVVNDCLVIEIKACRSLADEHFAQLLGYLRSSQIEHGLLINFGSERFQIKKLVLSKD